MIIIIIIILIFIVIVLFQASLKYYYCDFYCGHVLDILNCACYHKARHSSPLSVSLSTHRTV